MIAGAPLLSPAEGPSLEALHAKRFRVYGRWTQIADLAWDLSQRIIQRIIANDSLS
jgi:hypothetical protein